MTIIVSKRNRKPFATPYQLQHIMPKKRIIVQFRNIATINYDYLNCKILCESVIVLNIITITTQNYLGNMIYCTKIYHFLNDADNKPTTVLTMTYDGTKNIISYAYSSILKQDITLMKI